MTPDEKSKFDEMYAFIKSLKASATIPFEVDAAIQGRGFIKNSTPTIPVPKGGTGVATLTGLVQGNGVGAFSAPTPLALITSPTGGATIDSQARTAIDTIITRLESWLLVSPN